MNKIILEEAYRLIPVRDGDNSVELPAIQVVLRSLFSKAAKGDHRAQRAYVELVRRTEEEESALRQELFKAAIEYKLGAEAELEHCTQTGADAPELLPHPDDIDIDPRTGSVDIRGPMTREEKALWDWWQKMAQQLTKEIAELKKKAEQEPNDRTVKQELRHKRRELLKITELIREVNWPPNSPRIPLG